MCALESQLEEDAMRSAAVVLAVLFALAAASAAMAADALEIPAYAKAHVVTEINLTDQQILAQVQGAVAAFSSAMQGAEGPLATQAQVFDLDSLAGAISGLKAVRLARFALDPRANPAQVLDFYAKGIAKGWTRVIWDISKPGQGYMIMMKPEGDQLLFAAVMPEKKAKQAEGEKAVPIPVGLTVARTDGMVDLPKLASWFGNVLSRMSQVQQKQQEEAAKRNPQPEGEERSKQ